jgi:hypothetical protein
MEKDYFGDGAEHWYVDEVEIDDTQADSHVAKWQKREQNAVCVYCTACVNFIYDSLDSEKMYSSVYDFVGQEDIEDIKDYLQIHSDTVEIIGSDVNTPEPVINVVTEALEIESERKWVKRVDIDEAFEPPNYFLYSIPYDVWIKFLPDLEKLAADGLGGMANRIAVDGCDFYEIGENVGFVIRTFSHVMSAPGSGIYEIAYIGEGYNVLYSCDGTLDDRISTGICDGEFLYYMHSDGNLKRIDKNGEIKLYPVFESDEDFYVRDTVLEANDNKITVIPDFDNNRAVTIDVSP